MDTQPFIVLQDDDGFPSCRIMTIADYAATVIDLSHLPEFGFSPRAPRLKRPAPKAREDRTPKGPMWTMRLEHVRADDGRYVLAGPRTRTGGKADPVWGRQFTTKFSKQLPVDVPLVTPKGAQPPMPAALSRAEEIAWLRDTQHLELATDMATFAANAIDARSLRASSDEEMQIAESDVRRTPFAVRLPDEPMKDANGVLHMVPRYGDLRYIAAMQRRIEWEQWSDECYRNGQKVHAFFAATHDGEIGVDATAKGASPERVLATRRAVKARWLESHDELPSPDQLAHEAQSVRDLLDPEQDWEYRRLMVLLDDEDADPWRASLHADPDPKPQRAQYAFGYCEDRCDLAADEHNGCSIDGWDLFHLDLACWTARQTDEGYAGPGDWIDMYKPVVPSRIPGSEFLAATDAEHDSAFGR